MVANTKHKQSSKDVSHLAAETLNNPNASAIQKSLAGSVLSQAGTKNQTGALKNPRSSDITKTLAGSVVSQSNKKR